MNHGNPNPKRKFSIGNIMMAIMLKIFLKSMKKGGQAKPPALIIIPKKFMPCPHASHMSHAPLSDLTLDRRRLAYRCGVCGQRFSLKSDEVISQETMGKWLDEVRGHICK